MLIFCAIMKIKTQQIEKKKHVFTVSFLKNKQWNNTQVIPAKLKCNYNADNWIIRSYKFSFTSFQVHALSNMSDF